MGMITGDPETREEFLTRVERESLFVLLSTSHKKVTALMWEKTNYIASQRQEFTELYHKLVTHDKGTDTMRDEGVTQTIEQKAARMDERREFVDRMCKIELGIKKESQEVEKMRGVLQSLDSATIDLQELHLLRTPEDTKA